MDFRTWLEINYLDIGHQSNAKTILWVWEDDQIKTTKDYSKHTTWQNSEEIGNYKASGRVVPEKQEESISFGALPLKQKLFIVSKLLEVFGSEIQWYVFDSFDVSNGEKLELWWQSVT